MTPGTQEGKPLLAATDFSRTAEVGLQWAMEIAGSSGRRIVLAHAVDLPVSMTDFHPAPAELATQVQDAARSLLEKSCARIRQADVEVEPKLLVGQPSRALLELEEELDPLLTVLGTRGLTGMKHLLLGSTAERVVQRARGPVLTVHPEDRDRHRPIRTILVPTDFSKGAERALTTAHELLRPLEEDARLVLLHAFSLPLEFTAYGTVPTSIHYLRDTGSEAQERLDQLAARLRSSELEVESVVREGYPPDVIVEEAERREADLIAMGTRGATGLAHLLLGSTARRVVQNAPCPVLTVRKEEEE